MSPVLVGSRTNADLFNMKFLVLALCVCAASAASVSFKPWRSVQQGANAVTTAVVTAPEAVATAVVTAPETVLTKAYESVQPVAQAPAVKSAVYADNDATAAVLRSESVVTDTGFNYVYETANGIGAQSSGALKKVGDSEALTIQGQYKYTAPNGTPVLFTYVADENGYQPQSDHLPVGPAIPEAIVRALEYIRTHPQYVLALCVCAASAASVGFKPWQSLQQGANAVATAVVTAPAEVILKSVQPIAYEPVVKSAVSVDKDATAAVLRSESDVTATGFNYVYETANGIGAQSSGALKKVGDSEALTIQGQYKYTAPNGTPVQFTYVADENGYQPQSDLLPVGPAIPEAIVRALEYIRTHPQYVEKKY
ncbi:putative cuticle protein [Operophtera brumata]|uniref:Putative cuticle protein n=1 Tax=Operophtera brumata TaxID=104452 RepID=A0A0L7LEM5_OPEBR|nr:putative cuticle protein [Operophtera brumata]